jgi:NodT family efflux transporter outer membrane factor (OMF) lipoprotein
MKRRDQFLLAVAFCSLDLTACNRGWITTVGPDFEKPAPKSEQQWLVESAVVKKGGQEKIKDLMGWWIKFNDPVMNQLINAAQKVNSTLAIARSNIVEARSNFIQTNAAGVPDLNFNAGYNYSDLFVSGLNLEGLGLNKSRDLGIILQQFNGGLQSSWEVDLFGGIARQEEASGSSLQAKLLEWHDARISVAVETANAYIEYRQCQALFNFDREDDKERQEASELIQRLKQSGFRSAADTYLADATVADGISNVMSKKVECAQSLKGLIYLTGMKEIDLRRLVDGHEDQIGRLPTPPYFTVGNIPGEVIAQRLDIRVAERQLQSASAGVGAAEAKLYPSLKITGNISAALANLNINSLALAGLGIRTWSVGPSFELPIFDMGKRVAASHAAYENLNAAFSNYNSVFRKAIREIETALLDLERVNTMIDLARKSTDGYQKNYEGQRELYRSGLSNLIDALNARRDTIRAHRALMTLEFQRIGVLIHLYRAVGGGWDTPENQKLNHQSAEEISDQFSE